MNDKKQLDCELNCKASAQFISIYQTRLATRGQKNWRNYYKMKQLKTATKQPINIGMPSGYGSDIVILTDVDPYKKLVT